MGTALLPKIPEGQVRDNTFWENSQLDTKYPQHAL